MSKQSTSIVPNAPKASRRVLLMGFAAAATPMAPALANALSESPPAVAKAGEVDPIFEVIEKHRAAHKAMVEAYAANDLDDEPGLGPEGEPWDPNKAPAMERSDAAELPLFTTNPTTLAGAAALLNHVLSPSLTSLDPADDESILEYACGYNGTRGEEAKTFLARFAQALTRIALQRGRA
jgi:hypothetical protein